MVARFSILKYHFSRDKMCQIRDICFQQSILARYEESHDTKKHSGYLMSLVSNETLSLRTIWDNNLAEPKCPI